MAGLSQICSSEALKLQTGGSQIGVRDDVLALEDGACFVSGELHRYSFWYAAPPDAVGSLSSTARSIFHVSRIRFCQRRNPKAIS